MRYPCLATLSRGARALSLAASFALAPGCASEELPGEDPGAACDPDLSYEVDVAPVIARHCASCHSAQVPLARRRGAPGDHDFDSDSESEVRARAARITRRAGIGPMAENRSMPPPSFRAPSDEERALLASFLACQLEASDDGAPHHHH